MTDNLEYSTSTFERENDMYREEESLNPMPVRKIESTKNEFILISFVVKVMIIIFFLFSIVHVGLSPYFLVLSILEKEITDMSVQIVSIIIALLLIILQVFGLISGAFATAHDTRFRIQKAKTFRGILILVFLISFVNLCCSFIVHATTTASFATSWYIPTPIFAIYTTLLIICYGLAIFISSVFVRLVEKEELQAKNMYSYDIPV